MVALRDITETGIKAKTLRGKKKKNGKEKHCKCQNTYRSESTREKETASEHWKAKINKTCKNTGVRF